MPSLHSSPAFSKKCVSPPLDVTTDGQRETDISGLVYDNRTHVITENTLLLETNTEEITHRNHNTERG